MREYLLVCVVAAVITFVTTPAIRWAALRFGAVTPVRGRDVHSVPIPRLGGIAMLLGFGAALLAASQLPYLSQLDARQLTGIFVAAVLITGLGAVDDFRDLDAVTKFAGQIIAAGVMAYSGVLMVQVPSGDSYTILPTPILVTLTVFIVIATTNAVNFADGLDGLAAGMVATAAIAFFLWAYSQSPHYDPPNVFSVATFVSAAIVGCCAGFLPHNFHPAKLFMGDAGALLLGLLLAAATISFTGNVDPSTLSSGGASLAVAFWLPIALPMLILAVPILDVIMAVIRRGPSKFWEADAKHLHHQLLRMGHPHRRAVLLLYLWSASIALGVLSFAYISWGFALAILLAGIVLSLALTLRWPNWRRRASL